MVSNVQLPGISYGWGVRLHERAPENKVSANLHNCMPSARELAKAPFFLAKRDRKIRFFRPTLQGRGDRDFGLITVFGQEMGQLNQIFSSHFEKEGDRIYEYLQI